MKEWFCFDCHFQTVWDRKFWFVPLHQKFDLVLESFFAFVFWITCYKMQLKTHADILLPKIVAINVLFLEIFIATGKWLCSHPMKPSSSLKKNEIRSLPLWRKSEVDARMTKESKTRFVLEYPDSRVAMHSNGSSSWGEPKDLREMDVKTEEKKAGYYLTFHSVTGCFSSTDL